MELDLSEIITLIGAELSPYSSENLYEGILLNASGETVFREYGHYEYAFQDGKREPVNPFDEQGLRRTDADIVDANTGMVVLRRQAVPAFNYFNTYSFTTSKEVAEFIASTICIALNKQQEWYRLVCEATNIEAPRPFHHEAILKFMGELAEENAKNFGNGNEVYDELLGSLTTTLGNRIVDAFPHLDNAIERSASTVLGWDAYTYEIQNNKIIITYLGDTRILDFEMRLITKC